MKFCGTRDELAQPEDEMAKQSSKAQPVAAVRRTAAQHAALQPAAAAPPPRVSMLRRPHTARSLYLSGIGAVYVCAFASYWLQCLARAEIYIDRDAARRRGPAHEWSQRDRKRPRYPGLLGANGLLPAASFWRRLQPEYKSFERLPCLLWFLPRDDDATVDFAVDAIAAGGAFLGMLAVLGIHHASVFAAMFLGYLTLYTISQTWLGFQWDIFLLETGFATILYVRRAETGRGDAAAATWIVRKESRRRRGRRRGYSAERRASGTRRSSRGRREARGASATPWPGRFGRCGSNS